MNTALCPTPRLQFSDANGVPLAGGFVYTYAAGTTTPLATYADNLGATPNANPIVLDSGGFATIWLAAVNYKIKVTDLNGVVQSTTDNVSAVSQTELTANSAFTTLAVSGAVTVGGAETVAGILTAASLVITGTANIAGVLTASAATISGNETINGTMTAGTSAITGNETVAGTLGVTGAASVGALNVAGVPINTLITSLIPSLTTLGGTLVVSNIAQIGNWLVVTFGSTAGSRVRIAFGAGSGATNGSTITLPSGFTTSQLIAHASIDVNAATEGNQISHWSVGIAAGVISVASADTLGHDFTPTAAWFGAAWITGY